MMVRGVDVDAESRCAHWHSPLDIIAIKFKCCGEWYACYECHEAVANHEAEVWPRDEFERQAVICGSCKAELTIAEYLECDSRCPRCRSGFNPGCSRHHGLYFQL